MSRKVIQLLEQKMGKCAGSGPEFKFVCPFCIDRIGKDSAEPKLWVNPRKNKAVCYRCGYRAGTLRRLVENCNQGRLLPGEAAILDGTAIDRNRDVDFRSEVLLKVYGGTNQDVTTLLPHKLPHEYTPIYQYLKTGERPPIPIRRGLAYARKRAISAAHARRYRIGYCATGEYAQRLIFPVYMHGVQVYFSSRYCGDHKLKAKNPPNVPGHYTKNDVLFGFDQAIGHPRIAICEGVSSSLAHKRAVALFGKTISANQLSLIEELVAHGLQEAVVSLDAGAQTEAESLHRALLGRVPKVSVILLDDGDPDDHRDEMDDLTDHRLPQLSLQTRVKARATQAMNHVLTPRRWR